MFAVAVNPSCTVAVSGGEDDKGYVWKLSSQELLFECPGGIYNHFTILTLLPKAPGSTLAL